MSGNRMGGVWKTATVAAVVALSGALGVGAAEALNAKQVMAEGFKGKGETLYKKIEAGKGTKEENAKFLELCKALAASKPKKGDAASWQEKTTALVKAAQLVVDGDAKGAAEVKAAGNCKACHMIHKGA